jgi:hypothetical protein
MIKLDDLLLKVKLEVFWLSGSAAWDNGLNGIKGKKKGILKKKK